MKSDFKESLAWLFLHLAQIRAQAIRPLLTKYSATDLINQPWLLPNASAKRLVTWLQAERHNCETSALPYLDWLVTIQDPDYPDLLKQIYDPPLCLFVRGNKQVLKSPHLLSMVGSRVTTSYHEQSVKKIVSDIQNYPLTIVSGLAIGIDSVCHQSALDYNLPSIAVLASGLSDRVIYPNSNIDLAHRIIKQDGALISEYWPEEKARVFYFPQRNRILAGLSVATIVISGTLKSGTMITAQIALDQGRDVFCLPGNINIELCAGPNHLLDQGANILLDARNIIEYFGWQEVASKKQMAKLDPESMKVVETLKFCPQNIGQLSEVLKQPLSQLTSVISKLELNGLIKSDYDGNYYLAH